MEVRGDLTLEGWVEMAWIMGYIKHFNGYLKNGSLYVVESRSGEPLDKKDVRVSSKRYLGTSRVMLIGKEIVISSPWT